MSNNYAKLWVQKLLNHNAVRRAQEEIQSAGQPLPCTVTAVAGSIVTVEFSSKTWTLPKIAIPKAESPWIRMPTQIGDKGIAFPVGQYIGLLSGLGSDLDAPPGNLSSLVFMPVSNATSNPDDPDAAQLMGPNGAIIRTEDGTSEIKVSKTGIVSTFSQAESSLSSTSASVKFGANSMVADSSGVTLMAGSFYIKVTSTGLSINGKDYFSHDHEYTPGTGTPIPTGPVL